MPPPEKSERGPLPSAEPGGGGGASNARAPGPPRPTNYAQARPPPLIGAGQSQRTQTLRCPPAGRARSPNCPGRRRPAQASTPSRPPPWPGPTRWGERAGAAARAPPAWRPRRRRRLNAACSPRVRCRREAVRPLGRGCACFCCWAFCTGPGAARARRPGGAAANSHPAAAPAAGRGGPGSRAAGGELPSGLPWPWRATWTASWHRSRAWRGPVPLLERSSSARPAPASCSTG